MKLIKEDVLEMSSVFPNLKDWYLVERENLTSYCLFVTIKIDILKIISNNISNEHLLNFYRNDSARVAYKHLPHLKKFGNKWAI